MEKWPHVMLIERSKAYNKVTKAVVERHVEHIKNLDDTGKIELCGAFKGYPGIAGMVILKTESYEEAEKICRAETLVVEGAPINPEAMLCRSSFKPLSFFGSEREKITNYSDVRAAVWRSRLRAFKNLLNDTRLKAA